MIEIFMLTKLIVMHPLLNISVEWYFPHPGLRCAYWRCPVDTATSVLIWLAQDDARLSSARACRPLAAVGPKWTGIQETVSCWNW